MPHINKNPPGKCHNCESEYDIDSQGHTDDETGIEFCCQECECNYFFETGLPDNYVVSWLNF